MPLSALAGTYAKSKKLSLELDYSRFRMECYRQPFAISERLLWSGEIVVNRPQSFGVLASTPLTPDYIVDEGVLIYLSDHGLVIICGCGHRGVENIVRHCQNITGIERVHALIGGLHLRAASVAVGLAGPKLFTAATGGEKFLACHCTGARGKTVARRRTGAGYRGYFAASLIRISRHLSAFRRAGRWHRRIPASVQGLYHDRHG